MLPNRQVFSKLLTIAAAFALAALGWTGGAARASVLAYAQQQTSNYTFTGATPGTLSANSSSSASSFGVPAGSELHSAGADALESYVGPAGSRPSENSFVQKGQVTPDYAHGDSRVSLPPSDAGLGTNNVAETYLTNAGNSSASGTWAVSFPITVSNAGAVTMTFNYSNRLNVTNSGAPSGLAQASYSYTFTIQNGANIVFSSSPTVLNQVISNGTSGTFDPTSSGTVAITTGTLAANTYTANITGVENAYATLVPEPTSIGVLSSLGLLALARRRDD